jgi:hypothetical protein
MARYANDTAVPPEKSRMEIEATLRKYGARSFAFAQDDTRSMIGFEMNGRRVKFLLPMPRIDEEEIAFVGEGHRRKRREGQALQRAFDQAIRQRWRALALAIKAKLEAVEVGIVTFDQEFLAHIMLPNGETVGDRALPAVNEAYKRGDGGPPLLGLF